MESELSKEQVNHLFIDQNSEGQRLDNFLFKTLKGVPKSHIHKLIRTGKIRVNFRRYDPSYKLQANDQVRIPPLRFANKPTVHKKQHREYEIIYEDKYLLVINKPSGIAVHGGSGVSLGIIEDLRLQIHAPYLELVHRLDKDTSGLLMIAKKRSSLRFLQTAMREHHIKKQYLTLSTAPWNSQKRDITWPLTKYNGKNGEKIVRVDLKNGQKAHSQFRLLTHFGSFSLLEVTLKTGRTHQIRVHMQKEGTPIALDERYGNYLLNRQLKKQGLSRLFLHAARLVVPSPAPEGGLLYLEAPLPKELQNFLQHLEKGKVTV